MSRPSQIQTRSQKAKSEGFETSSVQIVKLNQELQILKTQNEKLQRQLNLQVKALKNKTSPPVNGNLDKWLKDEHIKTGFQCYSTHASQYRKDIY